VQSRILRNQAIRIKLREVYGEGDNADQEDLELQTHHL
jgi:hypothetical protein